MIAAPAWNVVWLIVAVLVALVIGTIARVAWLRAWPSVQGQSQLASLRTWWLLTALLVAAVLVGRTAVVPLFAIASWLGLREFFDITKQEGSSRVGQWMAYSYVPLNYLWVWLGWYEAFWISMPVAMLAIVSADAILMKEEVNSAWQVTSRVRGVLLLVFCLSHAPLLLSLPKEANPVAGPAGWFLYLVLLTEINDIAQALWGRRFGVHRITPRISPHKTWEGWLLGAITTVAIASLLSTFLTPLNDIPPSTHGEASYTRLSVWPLIIGFAIAVGGFLGDITMSAVKRHAGVKDSGTLLPGMGGVLDRIDSLTFTAPLFFYFVFILCGS